MIMAFESLSTKINKALRDISGKGKLTEANMDGMLREIRVALLEADVNYHIVKEFLANVKEKSLGTDVIESVNPGQMVVKIVHDEILNLLGENEATINYNENGMTVMMMVGLQGTGKTTSMAKIANILKNKQGRKILMVAADVIRPAAIEQLKTLGTQIGVEVFSLGTEVKALDTVKAAMDYAAKGDFDTVMIDTAGRLHIDEELMQELVDINDLVKPHEILLTVDAMTGQDIVSVARTFHETLPVSGLVVTKFDGDSRGGGVLSVRSITQVPVKFVGTGEKIEDMDIFYPDRMADRILGMGDIVSFVEQAQEKLDMEASEKAAKHILEGNFTMEDMLIQFDQVSRMGTISGILKMIPGFNQLAPQVDDEEANRNMKHTKAIIQSMTPYERAHPEKIRNSMKRRIAAGSGTTVNEVNKCINQFEKMRKMMNSMGGMMKRGTFNEDSLEKLMGGMPQPPKGKNPYRF